MLLTAHLHNPALPLFHSSESKLSQVQMICRVLLIKLRWLNDATCLDHCGETVQEHEGWPPVVSEMRMSGYSRRNSVGIENLSQKPSWSALQTFLGLFTSMQGEGAGHLSGQMRCAVQGYLHKHLTSGVWLWSVLPSQSYSSNLYFICTFSHWKLAW